MVRRDGTGMLPGKAAGFAFSNRTKAGAYALHAVAVPVDLPGEAWRTAFAESLLLPGRQHRNRFHLLGRQVVPDQPLRPAAI